MKRIAVVLYAGLLGACWQPVGKDEGQVRASVVAEFHREVTPAEIAALDGDSIVAARAALALGRSKRPEALPPLRAHVHATDPAVRAMVVYALGLGGDAVSLQDVRAAERDENSAVRYAAVDALGRIYAVTPAAADRGAATDLLATGSSDADATVRGHALAQLDAFRKAPFARSVAFALQARERMDRDPAVRWHAAWMLFRAYAKFADLAFLARAAHDPEELVRVETVRALGHRSEAAAIAIVRPLLADPSWRVQFEAREALRRLTLLPPTEHLKVMPPGIALPPRTPSSPRDGSPPPAAAKPVAPDPATFALGNTLLPRSANAMNGPAPGPHPRVLLATSKGDVIVRLYPEWAPATVANFLELVNDGYLDGNRWFRIVPDFVDQTGDPTNTGDGDAGYTIPAEENPIEQRSGIIAMGLNYDANGPERDSAGTQFYVTLSPQLHLDRAFSVFGEIESGFGTLATMDERDVIRFARRVNDD